MQICYRSFVSMIRDMHHNVMQGDALDVDIKGNMQLTT